MARSYGPQSWPAVMARPSLLPPLMNLSSTSGILGAIGNTPMVELRTVVPDGCARIFAKIESANPTGSMKDRMALAAIDGAAASGALEPDGTVVEYTAGTTGISLSLVCAARGYKVEMVTSDAFSEEKRRAMRAFGAVVTEVPSDNRRINEALIKEMIRVAGEISRRPGHWACDQLNNHDAILGYLPLGHEIWEQSGGGVNAFVHSVGTAHAIHGVTRALWSHDESIRIVAVEPAESAILSGGTSGSHRIEGIGIGFLPPLWEPQMVNDIRRVSSADAQQMASRLAREEGIFAGTSSGANVAAAIEVGLELGSDARVVTLIVDSGLRYLSTDLFNDVG
jgi:cysteine synthase